MDVNPIITESEIDNLEQSILEKLNIPTGDAPAPAEGDAPVTVTAKPKKAEKHTKIDLINDIMKVEAENGGEVTDEKKLKRMTKQELEKHLAESLNRKLAPIVGVSPQASKVDSALAVRSLNNFNLLAVHLLEQTSINFKDKTAGVALLEGWTKKTREMEKELADVFRAIIEKYGNSVQQYMDPLVQYAMVMTTTASMVVAENYGKKKPQSEDGSSSHTE